MKPPGRERGIEAGHHASSGEIRAWASSVGTIHLTKQIWCKTHTSPPSFSLSPLILPAAPGIAQPFPGIVRENWCGKYGHTVERGGKKSFELPLNFYTHFYTYFFKWCLPWCTQQDVRPSIEDLKARDTIKK